MSEVKVNKISPRSGTTVTLGDSGDTISVPTGVTFDASNATTTLPATVVTTDGSQTLTNKTIDASQLTGTITPSDNTVSLAKLTATGTKDSTTFLRGDNTFAAVGGGLTEVDMWRMTANVSNTSADPVSANLERVDDASFAKIGTGMSVSSGIWTFPQTGLYLVTFIYDGDGNNTTSSMSIYVSTDSGSTYDQVALKNAGDGSGWYTGDNIQALVNVTSTSTVKLKFTIGNNSANSIIGETDRTRTGFLFMRLGDSQ